MNRSWGSLVAREVALVSPLALLGCAPAAPEPVAPPPPPMIATAAPTASTPVATAPGEPKPVLGPFLPVAKSDNHAQPYPVRRLSARSSTFAVELADLRREWGTPRCAVASAGCNLIATAPYGSPLSLKDRLGAGDPAGLGAFSTPAPGNAVYGELSSGKDVVYAAHAEGHLTIDRLDAKGIASTFVDDPREPAWASAKVLELEGGAVVVGTVDDDDGIAVLRVARVDPKPEGAVLTEPVRLPYAVVPLYRPSAQGARQAEIEGGRAAIWGPWAAVPLLDTSGKMGTTWALALVQVNPPPFNWKAGRPYTKPAPKKDASGASGKAAGKQGAKHGCGGPGSRSLTDRSVEKIVHILRFDGAKLLSDVAVDHPVAYDPHEAPLAVSPGEEGSVIVDGITYGAEGKRISGKKVVTRVAAHEVPGLLEFTFAEPPPVHGMAFDEKAHEGIVAYGPWGNGTALRIDASGKSLAEPLSAKVSGDNFLRMGESWLNWDGSSVLFLSGPNAGKSVAWSNDDGYAFQAKAGDNVVEMMLNRNGVCHQLTIDGATLKQKSGPPLKACRDEGVFLGRVHTKEGKSLLLRRQGNEVQLIDADGGASELPPESKPAGDPHGMSLVHVAGDEVLVRHGSQGSTMTWFAAGKVVPFVEPKALTQPPRGRRARYVPVPDAFAINGAPLLDQQLIPDEPGLPFDASLLREAVEKGCVLYKPTTPRHALMACLEATDARVPGVVLGMRTFSY